MSHKKIYEIDGIRFKNLEEFYEEISNILIPGADWGKNLDAFNDILRGGFGTPEEGYIIRWLNSEKSKNYLGYPETVRQLQKGFKRCHPSNRAYVAEQLNDAERNQGSTVFEWLVEIIKVHCPDGEEAEDGVELLLE